MRLDKNTLTSLVEQPLFSLLEAPTLVIIKHRNSSLTFAQTVENDLMDTSDLCGVFTFAHIAETSKEALWTCKTDDVITNSSLCGSNGAKVRVRARLLQFKYVNEHVCDWNDAS